MSDEGASTQSRKGHRKRGSSISQAVSQGIGQVHTYTEGTMMQPQSSSTSEGKEAKTLDSAQASKNEKQGRAASSGAKSSAASSPHAVANEDQGLLSDIRTWRWMTKPASSAKLAGIVFLLWANWQIFTPNVPNPFTAFIFISHQIPVSVVVESDPSLAAANDVIRYAKGWGDIQFLLFYIIIFSFLRQSTTLYFFEPFAAWWGIKNERKRERFMEQGYAFLYWGSAGLFGLYVMSFQDSWWYSLEHLWLKYPHWMMRSELKVYYLLQFSYWMQQALVMLLKLEAPRKDYYELIAHHLVTLWLIGWSYLVNLTMIGTTVFVCMDIPDTWLAMAKGANYLDLNNAATAIFACLMVIWTYFRIWLSALTLYSVWFQFDLIPDHTREWNPRQGWWLVWWMKHQTFAPLFLLLLLNLFWYALMWRIMLRALKGDVKDSREEGEYDEEEDD